MSKTKPYDSAVRKDGGFFAFWKGFCRAGLFTVLFFLLFGAFTAFGIGYYIRHFPVEDALFASMRSQNQTSVLCDRNGTVYATLYDGENRSSVPSEAMPALLKNAFLAIEDQRFYTHHGVDARRTAGAVLQKLRGGQRYGGSTITQQLVKNLSGENEITYRRKLREIARARRMEQEYDKDTILTCYLNTIPLGAHCYGVEAAAQYYFGKSCMELNLTECAALAAIPKAPSRMDPIRHPEENAARRALVLQKMRELSMIDDAAYETALQTPLRTVGATKQTQEMTSWYTDAVITEATRVLCDNAKLTQSQAKRLLYTGGLTIETAVDLQIQDLLEQFFADSRNFPAVDDNFVQPECALVLTDAQSGAILGLIGGREKTGSRVLSFATDTTRPPGSAIKPLSVYAPALELGKITYASVIDDTPAVFDDAHPRGWPANYPAVYRGLTPVHDAVARSVNTVAVKVLSEMGEAESFRFLQEQLGISSLVTAKVQKNGAVLTDLAAAPLALGQLSYGVSVKELTGAYTCLADNGIYHTPHTVVKITDGAGNVLYHRNTTGTQVISRGNAQIMTQMLKEVTANGTASRLGLAKQTEIAGKTGTTGEDCDRWFVGYSPKVVCGVWFGYAYPQSLTGFSETKSPALAVFDGVMGELYQKMPEKFGSFETDSVVRAVYCRDSGKLITSACLCDPRGSRLECGYFTPQTLPTECCDCHVMTACEAKNGGVLCGPHHADAYYYGLLRVERDFPRQIYVTDAQYTVRELGNTAPKFAQNQPYYAGLLQPGHFAGISRGGRQFNRAAETLYYDERLDAPLPLPDALETPAPSAPPAPDEMPEPEEENTVYEDE